MSTESSASRNSFSASIEFTPQQMAILATADARREATNRLLSSNPWGDELDDKARTAVTLLTLAFHPEIPTADRKDLMRKTGTVLSSFSELLTDSQERESITHMRTALSGIKDLEDNNSVDEQRLDEILNHTDTAIEAANGNVSTEKREVLRILASLLLGSVKEKSKNLLNP